MLLLPAVFLVVTLAAADDAGGANMLRAGAAQVEINPRQLPAIINCGFLERAGAEIRGDLFARALVLSSGRTTVAISVVDSCMMPRELLDKAKQLASEKTGIPVDRMLISATHTHSAPAAMACLGSRQQQEYAEWLPGRIAEAIAKAASQLVPARVGAASIDAPEHTFCRRWIYKPDKMLRDPFGELSVRANMIPGFENPDVVSPAGPVDSELSVLSVIEAKSGGKPIAILANYANHYFGTNPVSPDYFGIFDRELARRTGAGVVMMSQGTSGDSNTSNYARPRATWTIDEYAGGLVDLALRAYQTIGYSKGNPDLRMAEARLSLGRRLADSKRIAWAEGMVRGQKGDKPASQPEVYAHEQLFIRDAPKRELKLQAIRIGGIALTGIPNEVYAITGLKLKARSPMPRTFNLELANGSEGYIPPPEQHRFGGYTTWAARTAGLETTAEPKIVDTLLGLLEQVTGRKRRSPPVQAMPPGSLLKPVAYWPLDDFDFGVAVDAAGGRHNARHEGRAAMYLAGESPTSRAIYLAGGTLTADDADGRPMAVRGKAYTIEFSFWPTLDSGLGDLLAINGESRMGLVDASPRTWHRARFVRTVDGRALSFVDGKLISEQKDAGGELRSLRWGGPAFEGKIDNAVLFSGAQPNSVPK